MNRRASPRFPARRPVDRPACKDGRGLPHRFLDDVEPHHPKHTPGALLLRADLARAILTKGGGGLIDHEKTFCPDTRAGNVFDLRGIDRNAGCLAVVRPDRYVARVLPLVAPSPDLRSKPISQRPE